MDYYKILGLPTSATLGQIKKAFRRLAIEFHPDKNPNNPIAEDKFQRVSEAYAVLSNPEKRAKYDRSYTVAQDRAEQRSARESQQSFTRTKPTSKTNNESPTPAAHSKERRNFSGTSFSDFFTDFFIVHHINFIKYNNFSFFYKFFTILRKLLTNFKIIF